MSMPAFELKEALEKVMRDTGMGSYRVYLRDYEVDDVFYSIENVYWDSNKHGFIIEGKRVE